MNNILCVVGPTASGKTKLSIELAKRYDGEVLSCDSMQIYRGMTIGTAKPTPEEMDGVPHHMIDILDPAEPFSVGRYVEMADPIVQDILSRGKTCVIVGGTSLLNAFDRLEVMEYSARAVVDTIKMGREIVAISPKEIHDIEVAFKL